MKITKPQTQVLTTLYDVATHEGGGIVLKNRYHSAAHALIRKGFVRKIDRGLYRPLYILTSEGMKYWTAHTTTTLAIYIPTYDVARAMQDANQKSLSSCSAAELIGLVKERSLHAQAAAVILLHDFHTKAQLPRYFSEFEIQRYFSQLPEKN
jgi:hypothetical protein